VINADSRQNQKQTNNMTKAIKSNAAKAKQFFADKMAFTTGPVEISHQIEKEEDVAIIDVRESKDFKKGHVPGAINLPQEKWSTLAGLRRETMNIVYCYAQNCHLGANAAMQFAAKGYSVMEMDGGFESWKEQGLQIAK
jgi:rhodanese-related sulfurtransferase